MAAHDPFGGGNPQQSGSASPFATTTAVVAPNGAAASLDATQPAQAPPTLPDINDVALTSETLTAREGDAYATPPPPPDGIYRVKLSLRGVKSEDMKGADISQYSGGADTAPWVADVDKNGAAFAKTIMDVKIIDARFPELDGVFLQVPFKWTDTKSGGRAQTSRVMTLLTLAGKRPDGQPWVVIGQNYGHKLLIETFVKFLSGEPELNCRSEWSVTCDVCQQAGKATGNYPKSIEGMHKFPPLLGKPGQYSPDMPCPVNRAHGSTKARAVAAQFFSLPENAGKK